MQNMPAKENSAYQTSGTTPTFMVKVVYSENFSVQGYIQWIEQEKTVPFRSYMELLHLIEEGLYISRNEMARLRSWDLKKEDDEEGEKHSNAL